MRKTILINELFIFNSQSIPPIYSTLERRQITKENQDIQVHEKNQTVKWRKGFWRRNERNNVVKLFRRLKKIIERSRYHYEGILRILANTLTHTHISLSHSHTHLSLSHTHGYTLAHTLTKRTFEIVWCVLNAAQNGCILTNFFFRLTKTCRTKTLQKKPTSQWQRLL